MTTSHPTDSGAGSTTAPGQTNTGMRASDVDRYATVHVLQDAIGRGLLTPTEGSDRMNTAFAAVYLADLGPITSDLPSATDSRKAVGWRPLLLMVLEQLQSSLRSAITGPRRTTRLGAALLLVLLLITCGLTFAHLVLDHGGPGRGGFGPGFDRR